MNFNKTLLAGRLTRDVETRQTQSGTSCSKFGLAVNERWKSKSGEDQEKTHFVDCIAWGKTGEIIAAHLGRGDPIFIEGKLVFSQWEANDGSKRSKLEVEVREFQFVGKRGDREEQGGGQSRDRQPVNTDGDIPF